VSPENGKRIGRVSPPGAWRLSGFLYKMESDEFCRICGEPVVPPRFDSTHSLCSDMDEPHFKRLQLAELARLADRFPGFTPTFLALARALVNFS